MEKNVKFGISEHMKRKSISLAIFSAFCFFTTNCGSVVTYMSPLRSRLVTETSVQSDPGFHYACELRGNSIYLSKTPYCPEIAKTYRHAKKQSEIALPIAVGELVLYGLGLVDMATMYGISEDSKKEELLGNYGTGLSNPCGKAEMASRETMVIRNDSKSIYHEVMTDDSGSIDLVPALGSGHDGLKYLIHLKSDQAVSFSFVY